MFLRQKYRLYPTNEQKIILTQWIGQARFVWNYMLNKNIEQYKIDKKFIFKFAMNGLLPALKNDPERIWLREIPSQCLQQKCADLDQALTNKFKGAGFPKFKSKNIDASGIRFPVQLKIENGKIHIPKMKDGIKIVIHREILGKLKSVTISKDKVGDFWASVLVEMPDSYIPEKTKEIINTVGIDLGLKEFAVMSDGVIIKNPRYAKKAKKRLIRLQQKHSKKKKGSNNKNKSRILLAIQHRKVARQRKDFVTQTTCSIAKSNDLIVIEDLKVKNMVKNHKLASSISDVGWGMFRASLEWQCTKRGKHLEIISQWFPSSKTCSSCGNVKDVLLLSERIYKCDICNTEMDRDMNAALNIHNLGLSNFKQNTVGMTEIYACGDMNGRESSSAQEACLPLADK